MHQTEKWKAIPGYEGFYQASDQGRIRRVTGGRGARKNHVLTPLSHSRDYHTVKLCRDNKRKQFLIHRLVAETFRGPCPSGYEVHHKNGNKQDNRLVNLEYTTHQLNTLHAYAKGHGHRKLTEDDVREIRKRFAAGASQLKLAVEFDVTQPNISAIVRRLTWKRVY